MADSLHGILDEAGIPSRGLMLRPGASSKAMCPACGGGRSREKSLSITVDPDGEGLTWVCHRGNCPGFRGGAKVKRQGGDNFARPKRHQAAPPPPKPAKVHRDQQRPDGLYEFWTKRGVSRETVDEFGLFVAKAWFPEIEAERTAMAFPYRFGGKLVGHKYRAAHPETGEKIHAQDPGTQPTLFNIDSIASPDIAYWVEGEPDVLALHEAGYRQIVSLRDGAPAELKAEDDPRRADDKRFAALETHAEQLRAVKKWILAGDNDAPGLNLREELARRLGKHRCWQVEWPEGCKDAGDVLRLHGPEKLQACIEAARPWPLKGLVQLEPGALLRHRARGRKVRGQIAYIESVDQAFKMPIEGGRLIIITGPPNQGKTTFLRAWLTQLVVHHGRKVVWASPEDGSVDVLTEFLAQVYLGHPFWPGMRAHATDAMLAEAERWIAENFSFLATDDPEDDSTIDWALDMAEAAVQRTGASLLVLDPWNEFEHHRRSGETETEYTGRTLKRLKAWGRKNGVDIVIVAHPAKPQIDAKNRKAVMPDGYAISGSAHWFNKADLGLTVWLPKAAVVTEVHCWKARYAAWGKRGNMCNLQFDTATGRFTSAGFGFRDRLPVVDVVEAEGGATSQPTEEPAY